MKLYTEEQVKEAFNMGSWNKYEFEYVIKSLTPIELPSDDKYIEESANKSNGYNVYAKETKATIFNEGFIEGAKWVIELAKQQSNGN